MEVISPLYSRQDAAKYLNVSLRTLDAMLADGEIQPVRFGRTVRIHKNVLDALVSGHELPQKNAA